MVSGASTRGSRILIADGTEEVRRFLARRLQRMGYAVEQAGDGVQAVAAVRRAAPDVVIADMVIPGLGGLALLRALHKADPDLPVIVLTERTVLDIFVQAMQEGLLFTCLLKPLVDVALLEAAVLRSIEFRELCLKARQADRIIDMAMTASDQILDLLSVLGACLTALTQEETPPEARTKAATIMAQALDTTAKIAHEIDLDTVRASYCEDILRTFDLTCQLPGVIFSAATSLSLGKPRLALCKDDAASLPMGDKHGNARSLPAPSRARTLARGVASKFAFAQIRLNPLYACATITSKVSLQWSLRGSG